MCMSHARVASALSFLAITIRAQAPLAPPPPDAPPFVVCDTLTECDNGCACGVCLNSLESASCAAYASGWKQRVDDASYCDHELDALDVSQACASAGECGTDASAVNCVLDATPGVIASVYVRDGCVCDNTIPSAPPPPTSPPVLPAPPSPPRPPAHPPTAPPATPPSPLPPSAPPTTTYTYLTSHGLVVVFVIVVVALVAGVTLSVLARTWAAPHVSRQASPSPKVFSLRF